MIKFIFRWAFRLLILAIVIVVALILLKDTIIKNIAESQIRKSTGMDVKIGAMHVGLTRPVFNVENFVLYNTAEFGGGTFIDVPDLYMELVPDAKKGEMRFKIVRMNVRELNIIENLQGRTNITSVTGALDTLQKNRTNSNDKIFKGIDTLNLTVGKIRYINMRAPKRNQEFNLALQNEVVLNVRTWEDMAAIMFKVLLRAGVAIYFDVPPSTNRPTRSK
ncbi:MAG TPA: hypothetical protein VM680_01390 [Verrucomicrobiae bacterium]|nr:hypothetical protein [Verrucomicrobiae bacterium]